MKKLIVGTVFADDSPLQQKWLDLQLQFLSLTTQDFDHVVVLSDGITNDYFESKTKVLVPDNTMPKASEAHYLGLTRLLSYFREQEEEYENFLFLDSDAFPIKVNWMSALLSKMRPDDRFDPSTGLAITSNKKIWRDYDIAAVLRCENLETRLHASVLFVKKHALKNADFALDVVGDDLAGNPESDILVPAYQYKMRNMALPLIRTNKTNVHPLACGIYFDMFYHHACGSGRPFNMRAAAHYMASFLPKISDSNGFAERLMDNPSEFVSKLAGWNPNRYAQI